MCRQPNARLTIPREERIALLVLTRDLERAMDTLPTESPWWTPIQKFYEELTDMIIEW